MKNRHTRLLAAILSATLWVAPSTTASFAGFPQSTQIERPLSTRQKQLLSELNSCDLQVRLNALKELANPTLDCSFAMHELIGFVQKPISLEVAYAVRCLGQIGQAADSSAPRLLEILESRIRTANSRAQAMPPSGILPLSSPSAETIHFEAAGALSRMGTAGRIAIPILVEMLENPGDSAKTYLKRRRMSAPEAEGYASLLYRTDDRGTYTDARDQYLAFVLHLLSKFGRAAEPALPAIEAIIGDPDTLPLIREIAEDTRFTILNDRLASSDRP